MSNIISDIRAFYSYYHTVGKIAPDNRKELVFETAPCKRIDFLCASLEALGLVIQNVALAILAGVANIATLGLISQFRTSLCKNAYGAVVHAGTVPVSLTGVLFPQIINQSFLKITSYTSRCNANTLGKMGALFGNNMGAIFGNNSVTFRFRRPLA